MDRALTPQEIDAAFGKGAAAAQVQDIEAFDFRKLDTIPKSQLQALQMVYGNFARSSASSLSAYLRSYVVLNLISTEQISYGEFLESISSPACMAYISLAPYDGTAILDLNPNLVFRLIELLLGSKDRSSNFVSRKITDIERKLLGTILRVMLHDLRDSWKSVADIQFAVQSLVTEPQLLHVLGPSEAMIVTTIEVRVGPTSGVMNLAIPSIFIKRLRNNFDQLQKFRRAEAKEEDQLHVAGLIQDLKLRLDVQIPGGVMSAKTLMNLKVGSILMLDQPADGQAAGLLNGKPKWRGHVRAGSRKLIFEVAPPVQE
jgi:flagellar motor switch protein FliM